MSLFYLKKGELNKWDLKREEHSSVFVVLISIEAENKKMNEKRDE